MNGVIFRRAVILGCGFAGIAAAAALQENCDELIIVEQDTLPVCPSSRRGVPQSHQLHNLLGRAQLEIERLLPGFMEALRQAGCGEARVADQTFVFENGNRSPLRDLGLRIFCARRPLIDHLALRIVLGRGRVTLRTGVRAVGLCAEKGGTVSGVRVESRDGTVEAIDADVVVDATGAGSRAMKWLASIGLPQPLVKTELNNQWYVTCICDRPKMYSGNSSFWLTFASPPRTRSGLLSPLPPNQWFVSLSGHSGDEPPLTFADMREFARTLEDPSIAILLEKATENGTPHLFRRTVSTWRRYDLLSSPLPGFLPIGDAIGVLNPLMGQGISVAAWQASGLRDLVRNLLAQRTEGDLGDLTVSYLHHAGLVCGNAWNLQSSLDQVLLDGADGAEKRVTLSNLIRDFPEVHRLYVRIWHLLEPPEGLRDILNKVGRVGGIRG